MIAQPSVHLCGMHAAKDNGALRPRATSLAAGILTKNGVQDIRNRHCKREGRNSRSVHGVQMVPDKIKHTVAPAHERRLR
jgi:hypothetical protein